MTCKSTSVIIHSKTCHGLKGHSELMTPTTYMYPQNRNVYIPVLTAIKMKNAFKVINE